MARPQDLHAGPPCPEAGADHKLYVTGAGRLWCPVTQAVYAPSRFSEEARGFVAGALLREGDRRHGQDGTAHLIGAVRQLSGVA